MLNPWRNCPCRTARSALCSPSSAACCTFRSCPLGAAWGAAGAQPVRECALALRCAGGPRLSAVLPGAA
eukprot:1886606-Pleurochrysis_carterae.AAC.7